MRIDKIQLSWFRGAADSANLNLSGKSMVVFGPNGSGKSSFVDAIEYVLKDGKVEHLAHEYSGTRQEKGIPNTHKPTDQYAGLRIAFNGGHHVKTRIQNNGSSSIEDSDSVGMRLWDYQRTILRQDEVAAFIRARKGDKYSALLPLLGLYPMEQTAENLRQLAKEIRSQANLNEEKAALQQIATTRKEVFSDASDDNIKEQVDTLCATYCPGKDTAAMSCLVQCDQVKAAIDQRISELTEDPRRHALLQEAGQLNLSGHIKEVRDVYGQLAGEAEGLIAEKLEVLQPTDSFVAALNSTDQSVDCPACGRSIAVDEFRTHIDSEKERLQELIAIFNRRKASIDTLCDSINTLRSSVHKSELQSWREKLSEGTLSAAFSYLNQVNVSAIRKCCGEDELLQLENNLLPIVDAASEDSKYTPPGARQLSDDKQKIGVAREVFNAAQRQATLDRVEALAAYIETLENGVREEIGRRASEVITDISTDVQDMWAILHPNAAIKNIRLSMPVDKAIDIRLRFHGVDQESPRLTLSEGYRNALGLCIFLALAKREDKNDRPLFLDDVVVSMDRAHRGMIADLIEQKFSHRQVIILTHDRDWYTDLRHQLDNKRWQYQALLSYESPDVGINWTVSKPTLEFAEARARLHDQPDAAANGARKTMDLTLAIITEKLQLRLPFLRSERNDKRMAHEFAQRIAADGEKCFHIETEDGPKKNTDAVEAMKNAKDLLVSWGNRGSHSHNVVTSEAEKLIDVCENALSHFVCPSCEKHLWTQDVDAGNKKWLQCECGTIFWKYK